MQERRAQEEAPRDDECRTLHGRACAADSTENANSSALAKTVFDMHELAVLSRSLGIVGRPKARLRRLRRRRRSW